MRQFNLNSKTSTMKKVIALLAIAGFVACNSGENKPAATDSAKTTVDTAKPATADTMHAMPMDSTKKDTAAKK